MSDKQASCKVGVLETVVRSPICPFLETDSRMVHKVGWAATGSETGS